MFVKNKKPTFICLHAQKSLEGNTQTGSRGTLEGGEVDDFYLKLYTLLNF